MCFSITLTGIGCYSLYLECFMVHTLGLLYCFLLSWEKGGSKIFGKLFIRIVQVHNQLFYKAVVGSRALF